MCGNPCKHCKPVNQGNLSIGAYMKKNSENTLKPRKPNIPLNSGWDETNFLGRDRDRENGLIKNHYETETEK